MSSSYEKPQSDLLLLDNKISPGAMGMFSEYLLAAPFRSEDTLETWGAICSTRTAIFGRPRCSKVGLGGDRESEIYANFRSGGQLTF